MCQPSHDDTTRQTLLGVRTGRSIDQSAPPHPLATNPIRMAMLRCFCDRLIVDRLDHVGGTVGRSLRVGGTEMRHEVRSPKEVKQTDEAERELERLKSRLASSQGDDIVSQAVEIDGLKVLAARLEGVDAKGLRSTVDQLKSKLKTAAVVVAVVNGEKVSIAAGVTDDSTDRLAAGPLVNFVAEQVGGKGGGRPGFAQAGGSDPSRLEPALAGVADWVREQLS